jgi:hypothetical protein
MILGGFGGLNPRLKINFVWEIPILIIITKIEKCLLFTASKNDQVGKIPFKLP